MIADVVSFKTATATAITVFFYLAIWVTAEWQDAPRTPAKNNSFDLDRSFQDLKIISAAPHPYNSHRNDDVHKFILERLNDVSKGHKGVLVVDDLISNATYANAKEAVYHESLNVLVFVNGTAPELESVLFSAHYDSVSTGLGATDDGMGVATLIQLVEYFAQHTPKRNAVFNINNGEEDWLNGAHVFLEHPFSRNIGTFLNLEGAGSGGRPMLFRSSNARVTKLFGQSSHPHGNIISSDAFQRGLIRSGTDYSVYEKDGMRGLDFAFYRHRNLYHTRYDSVSSLNGKAPLWNMLDSALATAKALTEEKNDKGMTDEAGLYFDILGEALVVVTIHTAFIINVLVLVLGPIFVAAFGYFASRANKLYWSWRGWIRFPIALIVSVGLDALLVFGYSQVNPYITYSYPRLVVLSLATLTALSMFGILHASAYFLPIPCQRHIILVEMYVLWWSLLVVDTVLLHKATIGALFPIGFFHAGSLFALLVALLELLLFDPKTPVSSVSADSEDPNVETTIVVERAERRHGGEDNNNADEDASEETPLLVARRKVVGLKDEMYYEHQAGGMWLWQFILAVPFPVLLMWQVSLALIFGLNGTLADGGSTTLVLCLAAMVSVLIVLPLAPFIHKIHWGVMAVLVIVFVGSTLTAFFHFPFTPDDPLKVFFKQTVDLDAHSTRVHLAGVHPYIRHAIIDEIPSAGENSVWCVDDGSEVIRPALRTCRWEGPMPRLSVTDSISSLLNFTAELSSSNTARFTVSAHDSRACRIYFDQNAPSLRGVRVQGASNNGTLQKGYEIPASGDGVRAIKLWSRTWDREWVVDVDFDSHSLLEHKDSIKGRVACEWSENIDRKVPALEEVETFLPRWAVVTKADDGLVEAYRNFEL